jgi:adenylate cyclase
MIGLEVHAHMLAQLLDGKRLPAIPGWAVWMSALLAVAAGAMTSLLQGGVRTAIFVVVQLAFFGGLPLWLHASGTDTQFLPAFGWVVGWIIAFAVMGTAAQQVGSEQRRFAQSALGKYLPRDIAKDILEEPEKLTLHGEKREIFVVFTDLEGFTALSHQIEPEMVATLLNTYLDSLCSVILKYGGTIDKFVGDAIVAFWGAPIARPDDGERAAKAAYELWEAGEAFRKNVPEGVPPIGKTRVGLHVGEAVIGNFGGEGRIQYTALGDSMNTASRLESANKKTDTCVLASGEAVARSNLDWWRPLGTVRLRGRAKPIDIFEPYPRYPGDAKKELQTAISEAVTDRTAAIARISRLAARSPKDAPLANLLNRFQNLDEGGVYALD